MTSNGGDSWIQYRNPAGYELNSVQFINRDLGWAVGLSSTILKTTDGGISWKRVVSSTVKNLYSVCFVDSLNGWISGSEGTILRTTNGGENYAVHNLVSTRGLYSIHFIHRDTGWAAGQFGKIIRTNNSGITSVDRDKVNPSDFVLNQNYPNPFNRSTKISWFSPVDGWMKLKIFDAFGREVITLIDEFKKSGNYEVEFNATELSSVIYFYQIQIGKFSETKKMIFIK